MMRLIGTLLFASAACPLVKAKKALRGLSQSQGLICRIALLGTLEQQDDGIIMANRQETMCIPIVDEEETFALHSLPLPHDFLVRYKSEIKAGTLVVRIDDAFVEKDQVLLSEDSSINVLQTRSNSTRNMQRQLEHSHHRKVAIVRVSLSSGIEVGYSAKKIHKHLFENENCMAQQFTNCLNGKLHMEFAGLYEVTVEGRPSDYDSPAQLRNKALEILAATVAPPERLADHVMVILPPCGFYNGFVANAITNHWLSTFNNLWSLDMTAYMHEIGHNLGRGHAYLSDGGYDYSSFMSATGPVPNLAGPLKCFNAADNKRLGFYNSRSIDLSLKDDSLEFVTVAAFSEWEKDYNEDPSLVSFGKYSMQYNLASKHNRGTGMLKNVLAIAHVDPDTGRTIVHKHGLEPHGIVFTVENFGDSQQTLQVEACKKVSGGPTVPSHMIVGFSLGRVVSPCTEIMTTPAITPAATTTTTTSTFPVTTMVASTTTTTTTTSSTQSTPTSPATPVCRNTSMLDVKFWWGNAYVVRSCASVARYSRTFCARTETSDPQSSRRVFDVCEQECSKWSGCQVSDDAKPVMKPPQPVCPDTSSIEVIVWRHGKGQVRTTCAWVAGNTGYCRSREMSGDPSRFYVYQFCEQECSDWVWCE